MTSDLTSISSNSSTTLQTVARPILVILHDIEGLDDWTKSAAEKISESGFSVVTPDLFADAKGTDGAAPTSDELVAFADTLSDAKIVENIVASLGNMTSSTRIGVVGFGWSGAYALMAAASDARFAVAADIGGVITYAVSTALRPGSPLNFLANLEGALFAAFAAQDSQFPDNEIARLRAQLVNQDKRGEVKVYDAPARFWREDSVQSHNLWRRLEAFLREHLQEDGEVDELGGYPNEASRLHA